MITRAMVQANNRFVPKRAFTRSLSSLTFSDKRNTVQNDVMVSVGWLKLICLPK